MKLAGNILGLILYLIGGDISVAAQAWDSLEYARPVDILPTFQGSSDFNVFIEYVASELTYPEKAIRDSFEGRIIVFYTIDSTGKVVNPEFQDSVPPYIEEEVERIILSSPNWTPGQYEGRYVNVLGAMPITFSLDDSGRNNESNNQNTTKKKRKRKTPANTR